MSLLERVSARSDRTALVLDEDARVVSWAELDDLSRAFAAWEQTEHGVARGDRVAVVGAHGLDVVVALLAHHRAGVVHVPINPAYQGEERAHVINDCGAKLVLDPPRVVAGGAPHSPAGLFPDDVALLIYTSGTTGKSKGCVLTAANVESAIGALSSLWEIDARDTIVNALPLFHVHGLCVALHGALLRGATTRLLSKFTPRAVVDAIAQGGTVFMGVPTMYRRLLDHLAAHPEDAEILAKARLFTAGSAPLPAADLEQFEKYTGHRIVERYGMSETLITLSNPLRGARKAGTVGKPLEGVSMRVVDGELLIKGPGVMREYWNAPAATGATFTADGYLRTGDLVSVDADGYVTILGRASTDFVKVGGYKVSTREVEDRIAAFPGVKEVAVIGVPDREWGERIVACLVVNGSPPSLVELQRHVQLAPHKWPREIWILDALPRNAMGKVQKKALASRAHASGV